MIKLSRFLDLSKISPTKEISPPFFYFILRNLSLFFFTTNDHEISGTKFYNSCKFKKFKEFQLNISILRINLLFNLLDSPYDSSCNGNGFKKKKILHLPLPSPGSEPMPITRNEQLSRVHTCSLTNESEGRGGGREGGGRGSTDIRLRVAGRSKRVVVAGENLNRFENRARN